MQQRFYELRQWDKGENRIAIDLAKHLQARQHLGTAVVICEKPQSLMSAVRKQWLRLERNVLRLRSSTLDAEEILRHTRAITLMQNMRFVNRTPAEEPDATVYFMTPDEAQMLPANCYSLYLTVFMPEAPVGQLMRGGLVTAYVEPGYIVRRLQPKVGLEKQVHERWQQLVNFLQKRGIKPEELSLQSVAERKKLDEALDALMQEAVTFLELAFQFQHALDLAQPLETITGEQAAFEAVGRLAYRVSTLSPKYATPNLAVLMNSENYFLRDSSAANDISPFILSCKTSVYRYATMKT